MNFTKFPRAPPVAASLFNPIQREAKFAITVVKNKTARLKIGSEAATRGVL